MKCSSSAKAKMQSMMEQGMSQVTKITLLSYVKPPNTLYKIHYIQPIYFSDLTPYRTIMFPCTVGWSNGCIGRK